MRNINNVKSNLLQSIAQVYNGYMALDCTENAKIFAGESLVSIVKNLIVTDKNYF